MEFQSNRRLSWRHYPSEMMDKQEAYIPRWCRVLAKGHENNDDYEVGDWILVEHGRWTRGLKVEMAQECTITVRAVEAQSVLGVIKTKRYQPNEKNRFKNLTWLRASNT